MNKLFALWFVAALCAIRSASAQPRDTMPDTWVGADAIGRALPTHAQVGDPKPDRFVAIFYFTWLGAHGPDQVFDITKILAANGNRPQGEAKFGPPGAFHWWGEPYFGYYRSGDAWVIPKHAQMLADAGVDVIVCDVTNAFTYDDTVETLFKTYADIRAHGDRTPAIAFIANAHAPETVQKLYDRWYKPGRFRELWFQWDGKPLLMADPAGMPADIAGFFTFRRSWAFTGANERKPGGWFSDGRDKWPWIDNYPQSFGWHDAPEQSEEMAVSIATHPIAGVGRSDDGANEPSPDHADPNVGTYFQKQWDHALKVNPKLIFVTGWNEWVAQRFVCQNDGDVPFIGWLKRPPKGASFFVDEYTQEFSRDAEPMRGGHWDNYYCKLVENIRRFKGARSPLEAGGERTIRFDDLAAWRDVPYVCYDDIGDVAHRDEAGFAKGTRLRNDSGRNDIDCTKVAADADHVWFYVKCVDPIAQPDGQNRLWLLIDADGDPHTGFGGFELLVNRRGVSDVKGSVERVDAQLRPIGPSDVTVGCNVVGNEMVIELPRALLGAASSRERLAFNFKWADHLPATSTTRPASPMDFYDQGDAAPNGRWAYRFDTSAKGR